MRLIDADAFIEYVNRMYDLCSDELRMMIYEQPTAYDVEKVVAELEEEKKYCSYHPHTRDEAINKAIDIVKRGGVE